MECKRRFQLLDYPGCWALGFWVRGGSKQGDIRGAYVAYGAVSILPKPQTSTWSR